MQFERCDEPLSPLPVLIKRMVRHLCIGIVIVSVAICIGVIGFHYFENMLWLDAFENSCMILSTMGPVITIKTQGGKLFSSLYALFSGLVFVTTIAIVFAPIVHRFIHKFHLRHHK